MAHFEIYNMTKIRFCSHLQIIQIEIVSKIQIENVWWHTSAFLIVLYVMLTCKIV